MELEYGKQYITTSGEMTPPLTPSRTNATHKFTAWMQNPDGVGMIQPAWNAQGRVASSFWDAAKLDLVKESEPPQ